MVDGFGHGRVRIGGAEREWALDEYRVCLFGLKPNFIMCLCVCSLLFCVCGLRSLIAFKTQRVNIFTDRKHVCLFIKHSQIIILQP